MTITLPWWFFVAIFFASMVGTWLGPDVVCANCHRTRTVKRRCGDHKLNENAL